MEPSLQIHTDETSGTLSLMGDLSGLNVVDIKSEFLEKVSKAGKELVLDLAGVTSIDLSGLNMLVLSHRIGRESDISISLRVAKDSEVEKMISLAKVTKVFSIETT